MKTNLNWWHFSKCHQGTRMNSPAITAEYILLITVKRLQSSFGAIGLLWNTGCCWKNVVKHRDGKFGQLNKSTFLNFIGIKSSELSVSTRKHVVVLIAFFFLLKDSLNDKLLKYWQVLFVKSKQPFAGDWVIFRSMSDCISSWCHIVLNIGLVFPGCLMSVGS